MLPEMQARLQAIATAALPAVEDAIGLDAAKLRSLTKVGREQLAAARAALDPGAVARAYPRDEQGRLLLDQQALLTKLDSSAKLAQGRALYLIARGPRIRRDGERIELAIADAIEDNESHRWSEAPWLWRKRAKRPAIDARAAECCALLDAGRFDEALALYGMALEPYAIKVLEGIPLGGHGGDHTEAWQRTLRRAVGAGAVAAARAWPR
jgi:hypothetical protein